MRSIIIFCIGVMLVVSCRCRKFDVDETLDYCVRKTLLTFPLLADSLHSPRNIPNGERQWNYVAVNDWTSGFFPGLLWYMYEYSGDSTILAQAERFSAALLPLADRTAENHDWGIMMCAAFKNAYRLTGKTEYRDAMLKAARQLSKLYNPVVGTVHSWPYMVQRNGWPHNTIIDNLVTIELLFWAAKHGGDSAFFDMACQHTRVTIQNQFREDFSNHHVAIYDTISGQCIKVMTHQGYSDESMWARGQAWAIYGLSLCYRESAIPAFLEAAEKAADIFIKRLPKDYIPYWDFDAPDIPNTYKDASAAAIAASSLVELSQATRDRSKSRRYLKTAVRILARLSTDEYQSGYRNCAFLMHSVGHYPYQKEVDASIIYTDYYYAEALIRLKKLEQMD